MNLPIPWSQLSGRAVLMSVALTLSGCTGSSGGSPTSSAAAVVAAAIPTAAPTGTIELRSIKTDGRDRTYRIFRPTMTDSTRRLPLVIVVHAATGSPDLIARTTNFDLLAAERGFLVVYPKGLDGNVPATWQVGDCCGRPKETGPDDVAFIAHVLDQVEAIYPVDPARVYATGFSVGASMAYRLGCELADRIAAVGAVAGTIVTTDCQPARPVSIIDIHGTADKLYPYEGEPVNGLTYPSTPANLERWRQLDGCAGPIQTTSAALVTVRSYSGCRNGSALSFYAIAGGGHDWTSGADPAGVDATRVVWEFFAAHPNTASR